MVRASAAPMPSATASPTCARKLSYAEAAARLAFLLGRAGAGALGVDLKDDSGPGALVPTVPVSR